MVRAEAFASRREPRVPSRVSAQLVVANPPNSWRPGAVLIGFAMLLMASLPSPSAMAAANTAKRGVARQPSLSLSVPSTTSGGSRVLASGNALRPPHKAKVILESRAGKQWIDLGRAPVIRDRFTVGFVAPNRSAVLHLRAVLIKGQRHLAESAIRRLQVTPDPGVPPVASATPTSEAPYTPVPPKAIDLTATPTTLMVGSTGDVTLPQPLRTVTSVSSAENSPSGVSIVLQDGQLTVSAAIQAALGSASLLVTGEGCLASECNVRFALQLPITVTALHTPLGSLNSFTEPSFDRIAAASDERLPDELLVTLGTPSHPGTQAEAEVLADGVGGVLSGGLSNIGVYEIRWNMPQNLEQREHELTSQPNVTAVNRFSVEPYAENVAPPTASVYDKPQWLWPYEQTNVESAWNQSVGSSTKVGVIDVGNVYEAHEDLNVVEVSNPHGGYQPASHATHVAGLACAKANDLGVVGMAWGCPVVSSAVGANQNDFYTNVLEAMELMAQNPTVNVVNISLGHVNGCVNAEQSAAISDSTSEYAAMYKQVFAGIGKNIVWTISAGNNCAPEIASPMAANGGLPNVIVVAATNSEGELATFSNFGPTVSVAAPGGVAVPSLQEFGPMSTWVTECTINSPESCGCDGPYCGGYRQDWGTSMAAPQVAGIAADVWAAHPTMNGGEVAECVKETAGTLGVGTATPGSSYPKSYVPLLGYSGGIPIVNAAAAVECTPEDTGAAYTSPGRISSINCASVGHCMAIEGRTDGSTYGVSQSSGWSATKLPELVDSMRAQWSDTSYYYLRCYENGSFCIGLGQYYDIDAHGYASLIPVIAVEEDNTWSAFKAPEPGPRGDSASAPTFERWHTDPSCAGKTFCGIIAQYQTDGSAAVILNNGTWSADWLPEEPESIIGPEAQDISCHSIGRCTAIGAGNEFQYGGAIWQYSLGTWSAESAPATEEAANRHFSVPGQISCSSAADCTAIGGSEGAFDFFWGEVFRESEGHWSAEDVPLPEGAIYGAATLMSCYGPEECKLVVGVDFDGYGPTKLHGYTLDLTPDGLSNLEPVNLPQDASSEVMYVGALACESHDSCRGLARYIVSESKEPVGLLKIDDGIPEVLKAPTLDGEELSIGYDYPSSDAMSCPTSQVCGLIGGLGSKSVVVMLEE
jgi:hypothetical protein